MRGTQICNFLGKIQPPIATKIKTNHAAVRRKNPEKLQILKPQYLDLLDSVLDDLFFKIGCFYERNLDIQHVSTIFSQKYTKMFWNVVALFFCFSEKKIYKNKKYFPTMFAKESALIPLVKNQRLNTKHHNRYTITI